MLAGLVVWLSAGLSATAQETPASPPKQTIRVAVEGANPPFNYMDQNNELQGFEIELLKAMCEVMKAECVLVPHEWDGILRGLVNRDYDAIVSSLEITERRKRRIAFSAPYYRIPAAFITRKGSGLREVTPQGLAGKTIGVTDRSDWAEYLDQFYKDSEIRPYSKVDEANLDLLTERIDAVFGDRRSLAAFLSSREGACCRLIGNAPADPPYQHQIYGIGLRKSDDSLREQFNSAIAHIMADGTYDAIRAKYFPFDIK
ncbi:transporter substrate-binding domain-containing protein [Microvirga sp. c23x22]|uniref:Transporter substrate-binding domain-containing protein n=2 Tax=Microvirga terricola TaxID=2719797 RepID=A0ABX0VC30_9HYPH|nr:transporter substrate-binding domain-containing protein [Microvirga terricola]NIX76946.1 transporter substrate-binding domain-containing protein [Microvirga terricola]